MSKELNQFGAIAAFFQYWEPGTLTAYWAQGTLTGDINEGLCATCQCPLCPVRCKLPQSDLTPWTLTLVFWAVLSTHLFSAKS